MSDSLYTHSQDPDDPRRMMPNPDYDPLNAAYGQEMIPNPDWDKPNHGIARVRFDFLVGDHCRWIKEELEVPDGEVGVVVGFQIDLTASVVFTSSKKTYQLPQEELELVIAQSKDDAVQTYKQLYMRKVQLVISQGVH